MYGIVVHKFCITVLVFFDYVTVKLTPTSRGINSNKVSVEMLQYVSTFTNLKKGFVLKVVWNMRKENEFVVCEEISGTPSCLWPHCFDCFCTVYWCVNERVTVSQTVCLCAMYVYV